MRTTSSRPDDQEALSHLDAGRPAQRKVTPAGRGTLTPVAEREPGLFPLGLRASATLDQMKTAHSPELGRSPFWERSSRAMPDPELLPRRVRRVGPRIVPAVKLPRWPPLSHGGAFWNTSGRTKLPHCVPQGDYSSPEYTGRGRPRSEVVPGPFCESVMGYPPRARSTLFRLGPAFFTARFTLAFDLPVFFASYRTS